MAIKIIIAEDEEITLKHLLHNLKSEGYEVTGVHNGLDAWNRIQKEQFDVVIADIKMPEMDGLTLLGKVKEKYPDIEVLIITGFGTIDSAVEAMKKGAVDYITKPFNFDELILKLGKIQEKKSLQRENVALKVSLGLNKDLPFITKNKSMKKIVQTIQDLSNSDCNVFITGETGTGKGLVAKLIHFSSRRKEKPFIGINCAVFTEELLASELFGHEKGAFTGAITSKQGLVEIADTGTLFLDEITEMSPSLQAKLLNFIEEGEFFRVGGIKPIKVDVRFIAATNQHIKPLITEARFREDLYYRLNVMEIFILPLRERKEDIEILSKYFLDKYQNPTRK
jgi:two-component system response regulator HydG